MCALAGRLTPEAKRLKHTVSRDAAAPLRSYRHGSVTRGAAVEGDWLCLSSLLDEDITKFPA